MSTCVECLFEQLYQELDCKFIIIECFIHLVHYVKVVTQDRGRDCAEVVPQYVDERLQE
jgi:hypothetical protein